MIATEITMLMQNTELKHKQIRICMLILISPNLKFIPIQL